MCQFVSLAPIITHYDTGDSEGGVVTTRKWDTASGCVRVERGDHNDNTRGEASTGAGLRAMNVFNNVLESSV